MNAENTKKLVEAYPILYRQVGGDPKETCMCFGFECGDGWFDIINEVSAKLEEVNKAVKDGDYHITALQVKEKFGSLRFYVGGANAEQYLWIEEAEMKSETTCESCGKPGEARGGRWVQTLCDECHKK